MPYQKERADKKYRIPTRQTIRRTRTNSYFGKQISKHVDEIVMNQPASKLAIEEGKSISAGVRGIHAQYTQNNKTKVENSKP